VLEHRPTARCVKSAADAFLATCWSCCPPQVLLASFGALPVLVQLAKQLVKGGAGRKRQFGPDAYKQEFLPSGTAAHSGSAKGRYP
jgi:hypothetical protein